jgi:hypothetical protein
MLFYCQKICLSAIFLNILSHRKKISRLARFIFLSHWGRGIFLCVARNRIEFILENCQRSTILKRHAKSSADTFLSAYWRQRPVFMAAAISKRFHFPEAGTKLRNVHVKAKGQPQLP